MALRSLHSHTHSLSSKPLPGLPSPTLTNPDMVLPDGYGSTQSPPRARRPPSPSYLVDRSAEGSQSFAHTTRDKGLGLQSRKMALHRSKSGSPMGEQYQEGPLHSSQTLGDGNPIASSPVLVGEAQYSDWLQPLREEVDKRASSALSSIRSDELEYIDGIPDYDDGSDTETLDGRYALGRKAEDAGYHADSREAIATEEELSSATLERAEQILANAKKRLLLMDQNLRGARGLIAPLTQANLKRATSVGSAGFSPYYNRTSYLGSSPLTKWAEESPVLGHSRMFSDPAASTELPQRPATALHSPPTLHSLWEAPSPTMTTDTNILNGALRGSRSQELPRTLRRRTSRPMRKGSPESALSALPKDGETPLVQKTRPSKPRPSSSAHELREKMHALKGRVSSLNERAREDSMRRRSMQSMRHYSPFTDAEGGAASDTTYPSRNVSRESGIDWRRGSDKSPPSPINELGDGEFSDFKFYAESGMSESPELKRAEVATYHSPHARTSDSKVNTQVAVVRMNTVRRHKASESFDANDDTRSIMSGHGVVETDAETDEESHYEDAPSEMPAVTPHEQREDAFDYQHFFLHSAMGTLSRSRSSSVSTASTMTARGPSTQDDLVPATPETPETLKLIERNLHKRTISADSLASVETFETAKEARSTPITPLDEAGRTQWPVLPTKDGHVRQRSGDRVDSGMGVRTLKRRSPPQSIHYAGIDMPQPPASVAVAALTDPKARQLGLKDKAMLSTLIESLKDLCLKLQTEDEGSYESRGLRRRLDEARRVLDGVPFADA